MRIEIGLIGDPITDGLRYVDAPRLSQRADPRCDVDAVAKDIALFVNDVAEIDPDAHRDALVVGQSLVHLHDCVTQSGSTARGHDDIIGGPTLSQIFCSRVAL
jgi:hypothetical protein